MKAIILFFILFHLFSVHSISQDGSLDLSFGNNGIVITELGISHDQLFAMCLQNDGKILAAGTSYNGIDHDFAIVRYNADGSLDTSFDFDGIVTTNIENVNNILKSICLQPDGKILAAGSSYSSTTTSKFTLVRYNMDGSLDSTFSFDGITTTYIGNFSSYSTAMSIDANGKILLAGHSFNGMNDDFVVVRYNNNGGLDSSFDFDGIVITSIGNRDDYLFAMTLQPDGKILVAGTSHNASNSDFAMVRYNTDGSLDTSFDLDGKVTTSIGNSNDSAYDIKLQQDGKILLVGNSHISIATGVFALARYHSNGSLDFSFDLDGIVTTPIGLHCVPWSMALQSDGKILVAGGSCDSLNCNWFFTLVRYDINGGIDSTFAINGIVTTPVGVDSSNRLATTIVLQPDEKIILGGIASSGINLDFVSS